jgi:hypothetical protein
MALLLSSVFGVTGCGSDDGEAPVESRIKNSTGDDINNDSKDDDFLDSNDLLPEDSDSTFIKNSPSGSGELDTQNLLNAGHHLGVNTAGCNMRNANRGLRSELPNPQVQVSPWLQSTICPDPFRRPLDINDDINDINDDINDINDINDDIDDVDDDDNPDTASLLPGDSDSTWMKKSPSGSGTLDTQSLLNAGFHVPIDTHWDDVDGG